ncbi:hypothetical protein L226DRAFT_372770 [Lentinus tigrinus ALCF2SS1-7]|uniref:uncharacterized protein n=1 Tax=Lentinus tigrinus ALCF2SS1-7 TaxID=1328758 RepID=UPI00116605CC|nr:hypothetical protein L226DRAFT_372770 [Lentinus tigrinus ALCF2SS1-7]
MCLRQSLFEMSCGLSISGRTLHRLTAAEEPQRAHRARRSREDCVKDASFLNHFSTSAIERCCHWPSPAPPAPFERSVTHCGARYVSAHALSSRWRAHLVDGLALSAILYHVGGRCGFLEGFIARGPTAVKVGPGGPIRSRTCSVRSRSTVSQAVLQCLRPNVFVLRSIREGSLEWSYVPRLCVSPGTPPSASCLPCDLPPRRCTWPDARRPCYVACINLRHYITLPVTEVPQFRCVASALALFGWEHRCCTHGGSEPDPAPNAGGRGRRARHHLMTRPRRRGRSGLGPASCGFFDAESDSEGGRRWRIDIDGRRAFWNKLRSCVGRTLWSIVVMDIHAFTAYLAD